MKLKVGQGFVIRRRSEAVYGLILNFTEDSVDYCYVRPVVDSANICHKMYDDKDADPNTDKDNVLLKLCPPPFSDICFIGNDDTKANKAYVIATTENDILKPNSMSMLAFEQNAEIIDKGECIKPEDMRVIKHHPWPHQPEKKKVYSSTASNVYREIPFVSDDTNPDFDDTYE